MRDTKIQWHPGFVGAMNLELRKNRDDLLFEKEYNLNTKPLEIDLLVIRKNTDIQIDNEIGKMFLGHNILEYKSPKEELSIDTLYKVTGYASLYKSYGETVDAIPAEDITVSLIRKAKPDGLFGYFKEHGYPVSNPYHGIYYIEGKVLFPTQVIVTKELDPEAHVWLGSLSDQLDKQNLQNLLEEINKLHGKADMEFADSVLEVSIQANFETVEQLRGDDKVCQALLEIMEPEINKIKESVTESVTESNILSAVESFRSLGASDAKIKELLTTKFHLSSQKADSFL